jgi:hypothetical protein
VQKARSSTPNNNGEFAARVEALRQRLEGTQQRLAGVARMQNALLESLARNELEQQKERIGTYQIQARFALASIYDRAAAPPSTTPAAPPQESQGELESEPEAATPPEAGAAPLDGAPPPRAAEPDVPATDSARETPPTDSLEPGVDTSPTPPPPSETPK